jgi:hypothetical protein
MRWLETGLSTNLQIGKALFEQDFEGLMDGQNCIHPGHPFIRQILFKTETK